MGRWHRKERKVAKEEAGNVGAGLQPALLCSAMPIDVLWNDAEALQ
jgi:hypothetical protein